MNCKKNQSLVLHFFAEQMSLGEGRVQALILLCVVSLGAYFYGLWGSLPIVGGVLAMAAGIIRNKKLPSVSFYETLIVILLILLSFVSCFAAVDRGEAFYTCFKLCLALVPMLFWFSRDVQKPVAKWFGSAHWFLRAYGAGLFILVAALLWGVMHGSEMRYMTKLNRGVSFLVGTAFPVGALFVVLPYLWRGYKRDLAIVVFLLVCVLLMTFSSTACLGVGIGAALALLARWRIKLAVAALCMMYMGVLVWPFVSQYLFINQYEFVHELPNSWVHRMEIWDFLYHRIMERPLMGWGIGSTPFLDRANPHGAMYIHAMKSASHPHNMIFQFWVELGTAGVVLASLFFLLGLVRVSRLSSRLAPFAFGAFGYYFVHAMTAFSFWSESLLGAMTLTIFSFAVLSLVEIKPLLSERREDGRKY